MQSDVTVFVFKRPYTSTLRGPSCKFFGQLQKPFTVELPHCYEILLSIFLVQLTTIICQKGNVPFSGFLLCIFLLCVLGSPGPQIEHQNNSDVCNK